MDIEKKIRIAMKQPVRIYSDNELGEMLDYFIKRYGKNQTYFICAIIYNLGIIHGKREVRARLHKR